MTENSRGAASTTASGAAPALLTFLIADVRGYTRFTVEQGDDAAARLASRFARVCEEVVRRHEGRVIELRGDEALAVFSSSRNALRGSVALQAAFRQAMQEDSTLPLTVGVGLDAGEAVPVSGGYRGRALNLAARLCSIARAGDVFASEGVIHLAGKTEGLTYIDRGQVTLKGLPVPVRVMQVARDGEVAQALPPLQEAPAVHPTNLPDEPTPFIGREREIAAIGDMLRQQSVRLVTMTGPGGTGKTRLALQVGSTQLHAFSSGVFFVPLASLSEPQLVPSAMAEAISVKQEPGKALLDTLIDYLQDKQILLVVDNFEHLLDAAAIVGRLLDACRDLHVLVTSRIPLHLSHEHQYTVPPLAVPDLSRLPAVEALVQYEAVGLFVERARAVDAGFVLTDENASAVAEICFRLDGLPLAILLAAARIKMFPPQALLGRLSSRLKLLTGGARDKPSRQQTLRGAIDWSYSLLAPEEATLFARLSVFVGGSTLESAESVCGAQGDVDVLAGIEGLIDNSLIRQEGKTEPRFTMLETIREYALEWLEDLGQAEMIREAHAEYFLQLAEEGGEEDYRTLQESRLLRLMGEHDNVRAALRWLLQRGDTERALRLAAATWRFWQRTDRFQEGLKWLEESLRRGGDENPGVRIAALRGACWLSYIQGDDKAADAWTEECLVLARENNDMFSVRTVLTLRGFSAMDSARFAEAVELMQESLDIAREGVPPWYLACSLLNHGMALTHVQEYARAEALLNDAAGRFRELGDEAYTARTIYSLGNAALSQGDYDRAASRLRASLRMFESLEKRGVAESLEGLAAAAAGQGRGEAAAMWLGAAEALFYRIGARPLPSDHAIHDRCLQRARAQAGEAVWSRAWEAGQQAALGETIADALRESHASSRA